MTKDAIHPIVIILVASKSALPLSFLGNHIIESFEGMFHMNGYPTPKKNWPIKMHHLLYFKKTLIQKPISCKKVPAIIDVLSPFYSMTHKLIGLIRTNVNM